MIDIAQAYVVHNLVTSSCERSPREAYSRALHFRIDYPETKIEASGSLAGDAKSKNSG